MKFFTIAAVLFVAGVARAQWQPVFGPTGGDVEAIASDAAGHVYAGTDSGVYMSSDNGATWSQELNGLTNPEIFSFAITPMGTVLAGTEGSGIFRSTNFGASWDTSSTGLPDSSNILSLASDGHGNLYAGHSMYGVFYSSDDGLHWIARNMGMDSQTIFSLTVAPNGTVYAGGNRYIFSSTDEGQRWDTALNTVYQGDEVLALAADSAGDIFAGTFEKQRFRLFAGSHTWESITPFVVNTGDEVRTIVTVANRVFLGTFGNGVSESVDYGSSWGDLALGLSDPKVYALTAAPTGYLFAGTFLAKVFRLELGLAVHVPAMGEGNVVIWPQPCMGVLHLSLDSEISGPVSIGIRDALGRSEGSISQEVLAGGQHDIRLDVSRFPNGVVYLAVRSHSTVWNIPFLVLH